MGECIVRRIESLMAPFEGLDDYILTADMPSCRLFTARHMAGKIPPRGDTELEGEVLELVLEACLWHAHALGQRWDPLHEPFERFKARHRSMVTVWEDASPYPGRGRVAHWLFGGRDEIS